MKQKPKCNSYTCKLLFECADKYGGDPKVVPPCGNRRACSEYRVEDLHKVLIKTINQMATLCCGDKEKSRAFMIQEENQRKIIHFIKELSDEVNFIMPSLRFIREGMKRGKNG